LPRTVADWHPPYGSNGSVEDGANLPRDVRRSINDLPMWTVACWRQIRQFRRADAIRQKARVQTQSSRSRGQWRIGIRPTGPTAQLKMTPTYHVTCDELSPTYRCGPLPAGARYANLVGRIQSAKKHAFKRKVRVDAHIGGLASALRDQRLT
jgi:hypothetical protein